MDRRGVIGVLGPIEILAPAHLTIRSVRKRAVLAGLALDAGREITVDRLIDLVWGATPPRTAHHALQVYISELRSQLGDVGVGLVTTSSGYRLDHAVVTTDIAVVDELVGAGRSAAALGRFDEAGDLFNDALARWRGEPFEGFDDVDEIRAGRARLDALRAGLRDELADTYLALGRHAELIPHLESRIVAEPLRERTYEHLMVALYRSGRQSDAIRVYQRAREALLEQVGVEPGTRLREIEAAVLRQDDDALGPPKPDSPIRRSPEKRPFVGRAAELDRLAELAADVERARAGRVVLVGGEPGIGKTRLVDEVVDRCGGRGWTVLRGRCPDERGAPPLWPVAEALRRAGEGDGAAVAVDDEAAAPLLRLMRGDASPASDDARIEGPSSFALHDAVADAVLGAAPERTVLVIDDVHWADEATLGVLVRLAQRAVPAPLLVLLTHRVADIDRSDEFDRALARLVREPAVTRLTLGPIDALSEMAYLEALDAVLSPDEVGWIRARSDGNPLFLTELVRLVEARHESTESSLPSGLEQVLDARLTLLGESADVLSRAAVIGREFDVGVLARLGVDTGETISRALSAGGRAQLIGQRSVGVWRFSHALVAEAAADRLDDDGRRRLHLRVAEVLDISPVGDRARRTAEVARHRVAALPIGDAALAAESCLRSGDDALAAFAYDDAANAFKTARSALAHGVGDDRMLVRALVGEAEALTVAGDSAAARPLLDEALELVDRKHDPQLFALAVRVLVLHRSTASAQGDERLSALLRDAIDGLGDEGGWLGVQLRTDLAMLHYR
ncbi:MAG TPA: BTAD domain-containing putative transcriptional regulator, partial [Ilumatobacteraceae bacterium]|nr:BTAD domain-containing putative transcriptional regulator [Ilumatobacteraceae bacterium]